MLGNTSNVTLREQCHPESKVPKGKHWTSYPAYGAALIILHDPPHPHFCFNGRKIYINKAYK